MGAALALPLLDAMSPALAVNSATSPSNLRIAFVYVPNGVVMQNWTPNTTGGEFPRILQPLQPFPDHTTILSGVRWRI